MRWTWMLVVAVACGGKGADAPTEDGASADATATESDTDTDTDADTDTDTDADADADTDTDTDTFVGPHDVGFFSSVAFAPDGTVWASGDDGSGLYVSSDGGLGWSRVAGVPDDHSTYSLVFDPTRPGTVYAPSHFGRGLLRSDDDGATWDVFTDGLPDTIDLGRRLEDLMVTPSGRLLQGSRSGLFVSDDGGETWARSVDPVMAAVQDVRALATDGSTLVAGSFTGRLYVSSDGDAWTELTKADGLPITDLAVTPASIYVAYAEGTTVRIDFAGQLQVVNDPAGGDPGSVLTTHVAVDAGVDPADPSDDRVWVGLVPDDRRGQLRFSDDGGQTVSTRADGLDGAPIFSLAIDPTDPTHVVVGTIAEGLFVSTDEGQSWTRGQGELRAAAVLGFADDLDDPDHLLVSVTEGLSASRGVYETHDGGATWAPVDEVPFDVASLHIVDGTVIAAAFDGGGGLARRPAGQTDWEVLQRGVPFDRWARHPDGGLWGAGPDGVWHSDDEGASWSQVDPEAAQGVVFDADGQAVLCRDDVAVVDGPTATPVSLGPFPGVVVSACAFVDDDTLLVASYGALYRTDDYAAGADVTWTEVPTPIVDAITRSVVVTEAGIWYASAILPDVFFTPDTTNGLWRSDDEGATWVPVHDELAPGRMVWELATGQHGDEVYVMMWAGGLHRLSGGGTQRSAWN